MEKLGQNICGQKLFGANFFDKNLFGGKKKFFWGKNGGQLTKRNSHMATCLPNGPPMMGGHPM